MEKLKLNFENTPTYEVEVSNDIKKSDIRKISQLAYVVNPESYQIIISRPGHATAMRSRDKRDFQGGWIFPSQTKITFYSGTLGEVTDKEQAQWAIESALGISFRTINNYGKKSNKNRTTGD